MSRAAGFQSLLLWHCGFMKFGIYSNDFHDIRMLRLQWHPIPCRPKKTQPDQSFKISAQGFATPEEDETLGYEFGRYLATASNPYQVLVSAGPADSYEFTFLEPGGHMVFCMTQACMWSTCDPC